MKSGYIGLAAVLLAATSCAGVPRTGVSDGKFMPCPASPNCVSSTAAAGEGYIEPLDYAGLVRDAAREKLTAILESETACRIVEDEELADGSYYLHAEFRSKVFRFVDDAEFLFPKSGNLIHVKSASRVGYSDMGVNRKRIERLRSRFVTE